MAPKSDEDLRKRTIIFSKSLSHTCITKCLSISKKSTLESLPPFGKGQAIELEVEDEDGVKWQFKCSKRKTGMHPKAVLRKGWLGFAKAKGLRVHDKVTLYNEIDGVKVFGSFMPSTRYVIEFQRADGNPIHTSDEFAEDDQEKISSDDDDESNSCNFPSTSISFTDYEWSN